MTSGDQPAAGFLHGDLDLWILEARDLPNMDLVSERLRRCVTLCAPLCRRPSPATDADGGGGGPPRRGHHHGKIITSDPYVTVTVAGATVARTAVIPNSQFPVWNEHFSLPLAHPADCLELLVKDNDVKEPSSSASPPSPHRRRHHPRLLLSRRLLRRRRIRRADRRMDPDHLPHLRQGPQAQFRGLRRRKVHAFPPEQPLPARRGGDPRHLLPRTARRGGDAVPGRARAGRCAAGGGVGGRAGVPARQVLGGYLPCHPRGAPPDLHCGVVGV